MQWPSFMRRVLPREDRFFTLLEAQGKLAHDAAVTLAKFKATGMAAEDVRAEIQDIEHKGDSVVYEMESALAKTVVTPMDREDLQRLSSQLDDVIDVANLVVRECVLFGVTRPTQPMSELIDTFEEATRVLATAVVRLRNQEYEALASDVRVIRKLEKDGDAIFRAAVSGLFHDDAIDAKVLVREKQILGGIEHAIDQCDEVAGTLSNIAVKLG
jgi:uncharacterized protein